MKKLKIKVFAVIFSLLSLFTVLIIGTSNVRFYLERKNTVSEIISSNMRIPKKEDKKKEEKKENVPNPPNNEQRNVYLDFTIYTIILDEDGNFKEIINNTNNEDIDEESIKEIANGIIKEHKENVFIGNLYKDRYSYVFTPNNMLVIMDNYELNTILRHHNINSFILFILCEIIIFALASLLTNWIIKPVNRSFEKQKEFIADASHELKTPLSVIIASTDAYYNDKDEKWINNIRNESEKMSKLVTDLLNLAKTEKEVEVVMSNNDLSNIVESSIMTFESVFYEKKIKLKYDIEPNIKMNCNDGLISELMSILIDNAIKHCSDKNKVIINLYKKNKQIFLEVKNTGEPISEEDRERIFERFYKSDKSRNRNSNSYGLGLAIAKNIVEKHDGTISVNSAKGFTTFKIIWNQR